MRDYRVLTPDPAAARELGRACGISATVAQVLLNRGITEPVAASEFLSPQLSRLSAPEGMADREQAADRLATAVRGGERIAVFGDYDVDGTTSAVILSGILEQLGGDVRTLIADRFEGGYGFSSEALERTLLSRPSLIVTCDCGSSDHERIQRAVDAGVDVIVVDHHLVPDEPLPALAFLNPNRPDCGFAYKGLCSAGLALSLGAAVRRALDRDLDVRPWLDLVALGTIADVMPLTHDNRALVRAGLRWLGAPGARPGVVALREAAGIRMPQGLGAVDVAFKMTPRLNACGRLGNAELSMSLLQARDLSEARQLAARVEQANTRRKELDRQVQDEAVAQVIEIYGEHPPSGIVAASSGWHRGVVGISASRLVDRFGVPTIVAGIDDGVGHGSGRTPSGFSVHEAVSRCSDLLDRFGGHAAAIGLTLQEGKLDAFRAAFADACSAIAPDGWKIPPATVDVVIDDDTYELPPAAELGLLEPVGESNPEPLFLLPDAKVVESRVVGEDHLKLQLQVGSTRLPAFGGRMAALLPEPGGRIEALGALGLDTFRGGGRLELRLSGLQNRGS